MRQNKFTAKKVVNYIESNMLSDCTGGRKVELELIHPGMSQVDVSTEIIGKLNVYDIERMNKVLRMNTLSN